MPKKSAEKLTAEEYYRITSSPTSILVDSKTLENLRNPVTGAKLAKMLIERAEKGIPGPA